MYIWLAASLPLAGLHHAFAALRDREAGVGGTLLFTLPEQVGTACSAPSAFSKPPLSLSLSTPKSDLLTHTHDRPSCTAPHPSLTCRAGGDTAGPCPQALSLISLPAHLSALSSLSPLLNFLLHPTHRHACPQRTVEQGSNSCHLMGRAAGDRIWDRRMGDRTGRQARISEQQPALHTV